MIRWLPDNNIPSSEYAPERDYKERERVRRQVAKMPICKLCGVTSAGGDHESCVDYARDAVAGAADADDDEQDGGLGSGRWLGADMP